VNRSSTTAALLAAIFAWLALGDLPARAGLDADNYQIDFPGFGPPPATGDEAANMLPARRMAIFKFLTCADELAFYLRATGDPDNKDTEHYEDMLGQIVGKMEYLPLSDGKTPCTGSSTNSIGGLHGAYYGGRSGFIDDIRDLAQGGSGRLNPAIRDKFKDASGGTPCDAVIQTVNLSRPLPDPIPNPIPGDWDGYGIKVTFTYKVTLACIRAEINAALLSMRKVGQLGSSDLPCGLFMRGWLPVNPFPSDQFDEGHGTTKGEWDVKVRDLVRIYYLNRRADSTLLDSNVAAHIFGSDGDLINVNGGLGQPDYSVMSCGDEEDASGTPEDRAADSSDPLLGPSLGDVGNYIKDHIALLLLALLLFLLAAAAAALVGGLILPAALNALGILAAALGTGVLGSLLLDIRVPETENHRMMIETSRYLTNQLIIKSLQSGGDSEQVGQYAVFQRQIKAYLLDKFQSVLKNDLIEYNALPYQRYTDVALLNLYDFADDQDLKTAAGAVLDYLTAKFAVGSNLGRRFVPFRRRMENVARVVETTTWDDKPAFNGVFDLEGGDDYMVGVMLLHSGQTQLLPTRRLVPTQVTIPQASSSGALDMVYPASSSYLPPPAIITDLAIRKTTYDQVIQHAAKEVYSSAAGYLLTAGGEPAPPAYKALILPGAIDAAHLLPTIPVGGSENDQGAGLPTTLMLTAQSDTSLDGLIRIEGTRTVHAKNMNDHWREEFGPNICVGRGFACGTNIVVPEALAGCLKIANKLSPSLSVMDSSTCAPLLTNVGGQSVPRDGAPKVYLAVYREKCGSLLVNCHNFGYLEAESGPRELFTVFTQHALDESRQVFAGDACGSASCEATYHTAAGDSIRFHVGGLLFGNVNYIVSINGHTPGNGLALGDIINSTKPGALTIRNPNNNLTLLLDLSDTAHPKR
jgi:hypothetical protein